MIGLWMTVAAAVELRPVRAGDTVESLAESLGDVGLADTLRSLNGLGPNEQPLVGQLLTLPSSSEQVDQAAFLVNLVGSATVQPDGGAPVALRRFTSIDSGSEVCTGSDSFAALRVATSCEGQGERADDVVLWSDTCVRVRSIVASVVGRASVLEVTAGSVVVVEPTQDGADRTVTVVAGSGIATGAGAFRVHLEPDQALRAESLTSSLAVLGGGQELLLEQGQGSRVPLEGTPTAPIDLLGVGPLQAPTPGEALRRPVFRWEPEPDAFAYRLAIALDARGVGVSYQNTGSESVHAPTFLLLPVEPGQPLWWSVAPIDRLGFIGIPTPARPFVLPAP